MQVDVPFEWQHVKGFETLWVRDPRSGFCQLLPGHPYTGVEEPRPGRPPSDMIVMIADLPVRLRYRLAPRPASPADPALLAQLLALSYVQKRAVTPVEPHAAAPEQLARFGAEAAASVMYELADGADDEANAEEVLVLVRGEWVMVIAKSFDKAKTDWIAWTLFNQAATQSIVWDPARIPPVESVWPPSVFVEPGIAATPKPQALEAVRRELENATIADDEKQNLAAVLPRLVGGSEPFAQPVTSEMKDVYSMYLKSSCDDAALWRIIDDGLAQVHNAYDLRGFAAILWRELTR